MTVPAVSRNSIADKLPVALPADTLALFLLRGALVGLELLCGIALARTFGVSSYGAYAFAMSWVALLGIPASMGFDRYLIREVSALRSRGEWATARALVGFSHWTALTAALLLAGAVALLAPGIVPAGDIHVVDSLRLAMLIVPIAAIARLRQATLQGLGHPVAAFVPECLVQPLALLAALVVWRATSPVPGSGQAMVMLQLAAALMALIAGVLVLRRRIPSDYRTSVTGAIQPAWLLNALPFAWMLGMNVLMTNIDTVIVGVVQGAEQAGIYRVASQMAMLVLLPVTTASLATASRIASLYASDRKADLERTATGAAALTLTAGVLIAVLLAVAGEAVLGLFGHEFAQGYTSLVILAASYGACGAAGIAGYVLIMTRHAQGVSVIATLGATLNIVLNLLLVPRMGMEGAATATGLSTLGVSVCYVWLARTRLGVVTTPRSASKVT